MAEDYFVCVEATDEADADALKERIRFHLKTLEAGDWSGRVVSVKKIKKVL